MKRSELFREVAHRTGLTQKIVRAVIECEEEVVYETIALNDKIHFLWGTLEGETIPPKRVSGAYTQLSKVRSNHGWTVLKKGVPKCTFSRVAKYYDPHPPSEWFEDPEHRYTTMARMWRKDSGVPEIPEYIGLPEDEIKKLCRKADSAERRGIGKTKLKKMQYSREQTIRSKLAMRYYWQLTGYIPMGALYDEALGDMNWTGPQRTTVDHLRAKAEKEEDPEKKAYLLRRADEIAQEMEEEKQQIHDTTKRAKEIEEKIRKEKVRIRNIEKKESKDHRSISTCDVAVHEAYKELREKRIEQLWENNEIDWEGFDTKYNIDLEKAKKKEEEDDDFIY